MPRAAVRKSVRNDRSALYALVGLTIGTLLFTYLLQWAVPMPEIGGRSYRTGTGEPPAPDFSKVIQDARFGTSAYAYDNDATVPAFIVAYSRAGGLYVATVIWDNRQGRYRSTGEVALAHESETLGGPPTVAVTAVRVGGTSIVVVSGPDAGTGWTKLFVRSTDALTPVMHVEADGTTKKASFVLATTAKLEDVDADGTRELVTTSGGETLVYRWDGAQFAWDTQLNWAFETRQRLFPAAPTP